MNKIFLFLLISCAHGPYRTVNGNPMKLCDSLEITNVIINNKLDAEVIEAVSYWNLSTGINLFRYTGWDPQAPINSVSVQIEDSYYGALSSRRISYSKARNCSVGATIYVAENTLKDKDLLQTVLRKEIGFLLGLNSTSDFTDLMYYGVDQAVTGHPLEASDEQIAAVRALYN